MAGAAGRRVLVVGASSGIGKHTAIRLAELGAKVAIAARRPAQLAETAAQAGGIPAFELDVRDAAACEVVVNKAALELGGLDALIYTAGWSPLGSLRDTDADTWRAVFEINTIGPQLVTRAALPHLSRDAIVAFMSSDSVAEPRHSLTPYAASKAALETTLKGWRTEVLGGVRFLKLVVGPTLGTDFARDFGGPALGEAFGHWTRQGLKTGIMDVAELGTKIGNLFTVWFDHPSIAPEEIVLRPVEPEQANSNFGGGSQG